MDGASLEAGRNSGQEWYISQKAGVWPSSSLTPWTIFKAVPTWFVFLRLDLQTRMPDLDTFVRRE